MNQLPKEIENLINNFNEDKKYNRWKFLLSMYPYEEIFIPNNIGEKLVNVEKVTPLLLKKFETVRIGWYRKEIKDMNKKLKLMYLYYISDPQLFDKIAEGSPYYEKWGIGKIRLSTSNEKYFNNFVFLFHYLFNQMDKEYKNNEKFKKKVRENIAKYVKSSELGDILDEKGIADEISSYVMGGKRSKRKMKSKKVRKQCTSKTLEGKRCKNKYWHTIGSSIKCYLV